MKLIEALIVETLLLDTGVAPLLAGLAESSPTVIKQAQQAPWQAASQAKAQQVAQDQGYEGTLPSSVAFQPWEQPWIPAFLQWEANWYPSYSPQTDADKMLDGWNLELETNEASIPMWQCTAPLSDERPSFSFRATTILTPHAGEDLAARIGEAIKGGHVPHGLEKKLEMIADELEKADILSQNLTGLHSQLIMRDHQYMMPPLKAGGVIDTDLVAMIDGANSSAPMVDNSTELFSLRAGRFAISKIWIVDCFGQVKEASNPTPHIPKRLQSKGSSTRFLAPPRVVQPMRLVFSGVSSDDDSIPTDSDPANDPVCGWIVPNLLDDTLMVFAADGKQIGRFKREADTANYSYGPMPGQSDVAVSTNPHLSNFLRGLEGRGPNPAPGDLLTLIGGRRRQIAPSATWQSHNLSIVIAQPLAVVRASARLELFGGPALNWNLDKVSSGGASDPGNFTSVPFPVRLGNTTLANDGLIGWFGPGSGAVTDYQQINTALGPDTAQASSGYVRSGQALPLRTGAASPTLVSLLMDPRCSVAAYCGCLPPVQLSLTPLAAKAGLSSIHLPFFTGPILGGQVSPTMPLPGGIEGTWSFLTASLQPPPWVPHNPKDNPSDGQLGSAYKIYDGWLSLDPRYPPTDSDGEETPQP